MRESLYKILLNMISSRKSYLKYNTNNMFKLLEKDDINGALFEFHCLEVQQFFIMFLSMAVESNNPTVLHPSVREFDRMCSETIQDLKEAKHNAINGFELVKAQEYKNKIKWLTMLLTDMQLYENRYSKKYIYMT